MTAETNPNDLPAVLEQLQHADPDLLRAMLTMFVQTLMSADVDAVCGAEYGIRSPARMNRRTGTGPGGGTPGPSRSRSRSRKCATAATFPTGSSSAANAPNGR